MKQSRILCELCGLEDRGTVPCAVCQKFVCVACSLPGIKQDKRGSLMVDVVPLFVEILCTDCNKPLGGTASRLPPRGSDSPSGKALEVQWEVSLV